MLGGENSMEEGTSKELKGSQVPRVDKAGKSAGGAGGRVGRGRVSKAPRLPKVHVLGLGLASLLRDGSKEEAWRAELSNPCQSGTPPQD